MASSRASGRIVANDVRHESPASRGHVARIGGGAVPESAAGQTGGDTVSITSNVVDAGQRFDFVGVHWRAAPAKEDRLFLEIRTSANGDRWSDWQAVYEEEDMAELGVNERYAAPVPVGDARFAQYRVWVTDGDVSGAMSVALTFMDVSDLNASPLVRLGNDVSGAWRDFVASFNVSAASNPIRILTRQDWGADESLMQWIPQYVPWKKAVVHHTVTTNSYTTAAPEIRAIYYFHAVTRGWGDIGYNYLVDKYGNIWIGRQGGDDVVGGHAFGWNDGSIGVAALGDFSVGAPPGSQLTGIAQIIAMKFAQRGIQPFGADAFTHKEEDSSGNKVPITTNPPNVQGHRDCSYIIGISGAQTACPGSGLYGQLNNVRSMAQSMVNGGFTNFALITPAMPPTANSNSTITVPVTIANRGITPISASSTQLSYRIVNGATGGTVVSQGPLTPLAGDIPPGGQQIVAAMLNVPSLGQYVVRWDLWQVGAGWYSSIYASPFRDQWLAAVDWDDTWISDTTPPTMSVGQTTTVNVTVKNTGARAWPAANVRLSYHWVSDVTQRTVVWNGNRAPLPFDVQPGQQVTIPITVTAPTFPTRYQLQFDLVWEGQFWFGDKGVQQLVKIVNVPFDYRANYSVPPTLTVTPGQQLTVPVTISNTGGSTWPASGTPFVELGTHWYAPNSALVEWDGVRTVLPQNVTPGQIVTLQANVVAPAAAGQYQLQFDFALEGVSWFSQKGSPPGVTNVTVRAPAYGAQYQPGNVGALAASVSTTVPMTLTNTGDFPWTPPIFNLAYHVYDAAGRTVMWDGVRTRLAAPVGPGQAVTVQANLTLPSTGGTYTIQWDMVQEGVTWFSQKGVTPASQSVTIGTLSYGASYDASQTPAAMATRMTTRVLVSVQNSSTFALTGAMNVYLSYHWYDRNGNLVVWDGKRSPVNVPSGASAWVWTDVIAPADPGAYRLSFDLVQEGVTWFSGRGVAAATRAVDLLVVGYGAIYSQPATAAGASGATVTVPVTITNTGSITWSPQAGWNLAYHLYRNGALFVWDGARTPLPTALGKDQSAVVNASVLLPSTPGTYEVRFDVVQEGVTWLSGQGVPTGNLTLTAQ